MWTEMTCVTQDRQLPSFDVHSLGVLSTAEICSRDPDTTLEELKILSWIIVWDKFPWSTHLSLSSLNRACYCCSLVTLSCQTLCNPVDSCTPGLPAPHHLSEFAQVHVQRIGDAFQLSHLLMPSPPYAHDLSKNQRLFQNTRASASASLLPVSIQDWSPLRLNGFISMLFKGLSGVFSSTIWRHQFFGFLPSLWCSSHNHIWPLGRPQPRLYRPLLA